MSIRQITQPSQPRQGRSQVTTSARPITQIGASSANTTFTATTVVSSSAWDLSGVTANTGQIVSTSGGWKGEIVDVDDSTDTITVRAWVKDGPGDKRAAALPADGETAIIHVAAHCGSLIIDAIEANTADVFVGFSSTVTTATGHPISSTAANPNARLRLEAKEGKLIDLAEVYVIAASTQNISWIAI